MHGFWERGCLCIFDIRITDTDARSCCNEDIDKVLNAHETEKNDKYLKSCHTLRKDYTPMVYAADESAKKYLATSFAEKWNEPYSEMIFYVCVRIALTVVRANSLLICGSRDC